MYQAGASGLFKAVSVTSWGQFLDATASRAYAQVGDDHAPGRWYERAQLTVRNRTAHDNSSSQLPRAEAGPWRTGREATRPEE